MKDKGKPEGGMANEMGTDQGIEKFKKDYLAVFGE